MLHHWFLTAGGVCGGEVVGVGLGCGFEAWGVGGIVVYGCAVFVGIFFDY